MCDMTHSVNCVHKEEYASQGTTAEATRSDTSREIGVPAKKLGGEGEGQSLSSTTLSSSSAVAKAHQLSTAATSAAARRNFHVLSQPPAWAPNIDVELELSGAEDPSEMLDFLSAIKVPHHVHIYIYIYIYIHT